MKKKLSKSKRRVSDAYLPSRHPKNTAWIKLPRFQSRYTYERILLSVLCLLWGGVIMFQQLNWSVLPLTFIALMAGLMIQSYQLIKHLKTISTYLVIAMILFMLFVLLDRVPHYASLSELLLHGFYLTLLFYLIILTIQHEKLVTLSLDESSSLILHLAWSYWLYSKGWLEFNTMAQSVISLTLLLPVLYAVLHGLFYWPHRSTSRFLLSLSTCIILVVLASSQILQLYEQRDDVILMQDAWSQMTIVLQYFLLGYSCIFLFQNIMLLFYFLTSKGSSNHWSNFKKNIQRHIERFVPTQVSRLDAGLCIFLSAICYISNQIFGLLPAYTMIWLVIMFLPPIISHLHPQLPTVTRPQEPLNFPPSYPSKNRRRKKQKK